MFSKRFVLLQGLNHDNVVKIKGIFHDAAKVLIIMEYMREGSLDHYLRINKDRIQFPGQLFIFAENVIEVKCDQNLAKSTRSLIV